MGSPAADVFQKWGGSGAEPEGADQPIESTEGLFEDRDPSEESAATAPVEPEPATPEEPVLAPVPPGYVPRAAMLDFRERAQRAERELAEFRAHQQSQAAPSIYDHPDGPEVALQEQIAQARQQVLSEVSQSFAEQKHGREALEQAAIWADQNPDLARNMRFQQQRDPWGWLIAEHKRDQLVSQIGPDPDEFVRRRAAELGLIAASPSPVAIPQPVQQQSPARTPPRSIISAPAAAGTTLDTATGSALEGLKFGLDK